MTRFWIGLIAVALVIAGTIYFFCQVHESVQYGFDFGSVVDAVALLLVALIVEYAYSKHTADRSADTELLLGLVHDSRAALSQLSKVVEGIEQGKNLSKAQGNTLMSGSREFRNSVHSIEVALKHCRVKPDDIKFDDLKEAMFELTDALTNTPYPGPYDGWSLGRIQKTFRLMRDELTRIAIAINHR